MDVQYTIHVNNLPSKLNEEAIKQIFDQYGKVTGMFYSPNATWTYISYGTYCEAELAIRKLNDKEPLCLKVTFAKKRSVKDDYLLYKFLEQNPKIEEYIAKVYEKRHNGTRDTGLINSDIVHHAQGLYEYAENNLKNEAQKCYICFTKTTKHCKKCHTYYCNRVCQVNDWPQHQAKCECALVSVKETVNNKLSLQISKDENQAKIISMPSVTSKTIGSNDVRSQQPDMFNVVQAENSIDINANINIHKNNAKETIVVKVQEESRSSLLCTTESSQSNINNAVEKSVLQINKDSKIPITMLKLWKSVTSISAFSKLKSGSKVCLTSYRNQCVMFVRSLDEAEEDCYNNILQHVARCARTAPYLSDPPSIGQIVIAPFHDGNNYRARIRKIQGDKAQIEYIDFGNIDETSIKELQVLTDDLALQQSCSIRIFLKDVPRNMPMNADVDLHLRNLLGKEISMTCMYEDEPFKDGVHLIMSTGESVNDKINQLLLPSWMQKNYNDQTCYMMDDTEIASLGHVGDTVNAMILSIEENGKGYYMCPVDIDLITYITEVMPVLLKKYCENTEYYIPRRQELCLVLYKGAWYRAICIIIPKSSHTLSLLVFFIDYGNIESIEHKNIRLMPKDFIIPAALANMCTVVNLAPVDNSGNYSPAIQQKIAELVRLDSIVKIKIVECVTKSEYKVELPDVRTTLIKEGLILLS